MNFSIVTLTRRGLFLFMLPMLLFLACGGPSTGVQVPPASSTPIEAESIEPTTELGEEIPQSPSATPQTVAGDTIEAATSPPPAVSVTVETATSQPTEVTPMTAESPVITSTDEAVPPADPSLGTITGRITFVSNAQEVQPDTDATVEIVGNTTSDYFSAQTDQEGRYTFANVTPGQYWVMARSPIGSSNPLLVTVNAGEIRTVEELRTFSGYPFVIMRPAGGYIFVDGVPVAGAAVWQFGGLFSGDTVAVTDESGYFSFLYLADNPIIAVFGDRWETTTLVPDQIIDIELSRQGPHPQPPAGPPVTPVPVGSDIIVIIPTPPSVILRPTRLIPEIIVIVPTPPQIVLEATKPILRGTVPVISTGVPIKPQATPIPRDATPAVVVDRSIPKTCGQSKTSPDYGPIKVDSQVILGQHIAVDGESGWDEAMEKYIKQQATVTKLAGVDSVGCPVVRVDIDNGDWLWRIRALTLVD